MNIGAAELVIITVVGIGVALLVFILVGRRAGSTSEADRWAASEGVTLDATTGPVVRNYLHTSRNLRQLGAVGGLLIAPAVTAATGLDLELPGLLWLLTGYLIGCLWAELALTRQATTTRRSATLTPRHLTDYLPRAMLRVQVAATAVTVGLGLVGAALIDGAGSEPATSTWPTGDATDVIRRGALLAGILAPLATAGVVTAQRTIVRRPQPLLNAAHIAVDDAMRSSSVRLLGATGIAIVGTLASVQLSYLTVLVAPGAAVIVGMTSIVLVLVALLQWRWWPHRGWRVRRPAPPIRTAVLTGTATAPTSGDDHG